MEEQIIRAKDQKVTALIDCCRSILGDKSIRVLAVGATKLQDKCLYCVVKNCEITDIYLRTESKEVKESDYKQESETIALLNWDEKQNKYISPDVYKFHYLSRLLADVKADKALYKTYKSIVRSILDDSDGGAVTSNANSEKVIGFLSAVRQNFLENEVK